MKIEPIGIVNVEGGLNVSLRGSLAEIAVDLKSGSERSRFVAGLMNSDHPGIERLFDGSFLVIGFTADRGKYFPDW